MATERNVVDFKIHNLSEEKFQELKEAGQIDPNALYCTPDNTKAEITKKANDSDVVHKKGNETIGGQKTFTSGTIWKKEDWEATQNPTSNKFATWSQVCDANYSMFSYVETSYLTDGTVQQSFGVRKEINGTKYTANIRTRVDANGNTFVELGSSPASSSNGTQVATTYWANAKFLPLAGGTITGNIAITKETPQINLKSTVMDITSSGWAAGRNTIAWCMDKNGHESAGVYNTTDSAGTARASLYVMSRKSGSQIQASLGVGINSSGMTYATAPNTPDGAGSNEVVTAGWAKLKFLPLAGGTITGVITTKSQIMFENASSSANRGFLYKTSDGAFSMGISKSDNSGWQSYQSFFTSGQYQMTVSDGTNTKNLIAKPDGTLTWDGKQIVRLVAEQKATSANDYKWYRKYSDGWVEQGGIHHRGSAGDTVNLPIAMSNEYYELQLTAVNSDPIARYAYANTHTSTYFKCGTADDSSPNNDGDIRWYVCGYAAS